VDGVSEKMLAQTLHALERDGLINRDVQSAISPRVRVQPPLGDRVANMLLELIGLLEGEMPAVHAARQRYDEAKQH
jgi:DNA-binding HxlR family transcriptional regulator